MTNELLDLPSPAKLNLFLNVMARREDGYHNLQTVFQLLDFGDTLSFKLTHNSRIALTTAEPALSNNDNLVIRAANILSSLDNKESALGVDISLHKVLPMGGGIGGGSSNAATTLLALNKLWNLKLDVEILARIGKTLGADVPIFVRGYSAWAEGVGDKLEKLDLPERWFLVLKPECHVSTSTIFCHKDLTRDSAPITVAAFLDRGGKNDCQKLVETLFPQVRDAVIWLNKYAPAQLTGTGACVFAAFDSQCDAKRVLAKIPVNLRGFVAKGVNISPLHHKLS